MMEIQDLLREIHLTLKSTCGISSSTPPSITYLTYPSCEVCPKHLTSSLEHYQKVIYCLECGGMCIKCLMECPHRGITGNFILKVDKECSMFNNELEIIHSSLVELRRCYSCILYVHAEILQDQTLLCEANMKVKDKFCYIDKVLHTLQSNRDNISSLTKIVEILLTKFDDVIAVVRKYKPINDESEIKQVSYIEKMVEYSKIIQYLNENIVLFIKYIRGTDIASYPTYVKYEHEQIHKREQIGSLIDRIKYEEDTSSKELQCFILDKYKYVIDTDTPSLIDDATIKSFTVERNYSGDIFFKQPQYLTKEIFEAEKVGEFIDKIFKVTWVFKGWSPFYKNRATVYTFLYDKNDNLLELPQSYIQRVQLVVVHTKPGEICENVWFHNLNVLETGERCSFMFDFEVKHETENVFVHLKSLYTHKDITCGVYYFGTRMYTTQRYATFEAVKHTVTEGDVVKRSVSPSKRSVSPSTQIPIVAIYKSKNKDLWKLKWNLLPRNTRKEKESNCLKLDWKIDSRNIKYHTIAKFSPNKPIDKFLTHIIGINDNLRGGIWKIKISAKEEFPSLHNSSLSSLSIFVGTLNYPGKTVLDKTSSGWKGVNVLKMVYLKDYKLHIPDDVLTKVNSKTVSNISDMKISFVYDTYTKIMKSTLDSKDELRVEGEVTDMIFGFQSNFDELVFEICSLESIQ